MANFDWGSVVQADMSTIDETGNPKGPVAPGVYSSFISAIKTERKTSGAFGLEVLYQITDGPEKGRNVKEFICLIKKDGNPVPFGATKVNQRLLNFGLSAEEIRNFEWPKEEGRLGGFKNLVDTEVTIEVDHRKVDKGELAGMTFAQVKKVYQPSAAAKAVSS